MIYKDLTGESFGMLTVVSLHSRGSRHPWRQVEWNCICDCGNEVIVRRGNLTSGNTKSCGCLYKGTRKGALIPNKNRLYNSWRAMKARCNNPNNNRYHLYGARGIKVCSDWQSFENFKLWALNNGYADNLTIDRIDCNGDYEPSNCRWIPLSEQSKNRRCIKHDNES